MKVTQSRQIVLEMLLSIEKEEKKSHLLIRDVLDKYDYLDARDKAFIKHLTEGVLERRLTLDYVIDSMSKTPVKKMKPAIRSIIRMGAYQILYMDSIPDAAACNEAVNLAALKGFHGLKGFVNGVLRSIASNKDKIAWPERSEDEVRYLSVRYSMPDWISKRFLDNYGFEKTEAVLNAFLRQSDVTVRMITENDRTEELIRVWEEKGVRIERDEVIPYAYHLSGVEGVTNLEGFSDGAFAIQDISSMIALEAAGFKPGESVIDVCAAPGGKACFAAWKTKNTVKAYDLTERKAERIRENAKRLHLEQITAEVADATVFKPELENTADVVIADLPCSGLGVLKRKPEIRYRLTNEDILELSRLQRLILENAVRYVKAGGRILYSTCTITPEENEENRKWIEENHPVSLIEERQILPDDHKGCDGFYYAILKRED